MAPFNITHSLPQSNPLKWLDSNVVSREGSHKTMPETKPSVISFLLLRIIYATTSYRPKRRTTGNNPDCGRWKRGH